MFWERIYGLVSNVQCQMLCDLCMETKASRVIEVGSFRGKSTIAIATGMSANPSPMLITVDPFKDYDIGGRTFYEAYGNTAKSLFLANVEQSGYSSIIKHYDSMPELEELDGAFIDGDHRYEAVRADFEAIYPHLKPGGWLVLHDYGSHDGPTRMGKEMCWQFRDIKIIENMALGYKL